LSELGFIGLGDYGIMGCVLFENLLRG